MSAGRCEWCDVEVPDAIECPPGFMLQAITPVTLCRFCYQTGEHLARRSDFSGLSMQINRSFNLLRQMLVLPRDLSTLEWQPIETYVRPVEVYSFSHPEALFYGPKEGIRLGQCVRWSDDEDEEKQFYFEYGDSWRFDPTHWMPLPAAPK